MPTLRQVDGGYRIPVTINPNTMPSLQGLQLAADHPEIKNFSRLDDAYTGMNTKVIQTFANGTGRYLALVYDNWGVGWDPTDATAGPSPVGSSWDNPNVNDVTWQGALSDLTGTNFYRAYFYRIHHVDGTVEELDPWTYTSVTIEGGAFALASVDLGATKAAGTQLYEHAYVSCASGGFLWRHLNDLAGARGETMTASVGETSKVTQMFTGTKPAVAGPTGDRDGSGAWSSSIRHLDAPPAQIVRPTVVNGDSLSAGDYVWRAFLRANHIPHLHLGRSQEMAFSFLLNDPKSAYRRRAGAFGGFSRGILQYLTNDLALNNPTQTLALFQSKRDAMVALQKSWGADEVMVGTLPPNTKSTDGFATTANQVLNMASNQRGKNEQLLLDYDADCRQGTAYGSVSPQAWHHPSGFYVADWGGAETVMDSSPTDTPSTIAKWRVNGGAHTGDGLHPGTAAGVAEGLPAIPVDLFLGA